MNSLQKRALNFSDWYNNIVVQSELAENSAIRGCMIIKPYGYALWENIQRIVDDAIKKTGHVNSYFPLLIPKSYLSREAEHVEGFAKECAVVTHSRLKMDSKNGELVVDPDAKLEEEFIIRPTSETVIWHTYKRWIQSYRDLPLLINQWANVMRWEMRPRPFLRTAEILWQEGHTAHATEQEAMDEVWQILDLYEHIAKDYLAMPLVRGMKTNHERFAGAERTYTLEALMQDGKALQTATVHHLGQNFAKAFDVTFTNPHGIKDYVWGSSWGITTRLIGALIMMHGDDQGLILPPKIAPIQVVMIPIYKIDGNQDRVIALLTELQAMLVKCGIRVKIDESNNHKPGYKFAKYERQGVPIRVVIGSDDLDDRSVELVRRDTGEKITIPADRLPEQVVVWLTDIQNNIYSRALTFQKEHTIRVDDYLSFKDHIANKDGFILAHWDGTTETEKQIKAETKATIRCIPLDGSPEEGRCIYSGKPSNKRVIFAQAY